MTAKHQPAPPKDPHEGGSYTRNGDGSLSLVHQTKPSTGRRAAPEPAASSSADPAAAPSGTAARTSTNLNQE